MRKTTFIWAVGCVAAIGAVGCDDKAGPNVAPSSSALQATAPASAGALKLVVDKSASKVEFMMEAPIEKIRGRVSGAEGDLSVDPTDLTKTTGLVTVDLQGLEIFQTVVKDGKPTAEAKNDAQNTHARAWLEIDEKAPEDKRKDNARVQFAIRSITEASVKDITKVTGAERKVTLKAKGDFLLHNHKTEKTVELEGTFKYDGDKLASVAIKTAKPFAVNLDEYDVRPREFFGKLAQKTLSDLSEKVAKEAQVGVDIVATPAK